MLAKLSHAFKRTLAQTLAALCQNPFVQNLTTGNVYRGNLKAICAPGLNCYSCPAAAGSCPLGVMQSVAGSSSFNVSFYALGILIVLGMMLGRDICGVLCVFGFLQDLLYKIPTPKVTVPTRIDRPLRKLKYVVLALTLLLPALITNQFGLGTPYFCTYLCPAGTIEGALPLVAANDSLRGMIGAVFQWKVLVAVAVVVSSVLVYRPFCKYLCPLGAFYSLFNRVSFLKLSVDHNACGGCKACEKACPMNVKVTEDANSPECIRCGSCKHACTQQAIHWSVNPSIGNPSRAKSTAHTESTAHKQS